MVASPQRECVQCGAPNPPGAQFCGSCDRYLWDSTTVGRAVVDAETTTLDIRGRADTARSAQPPRVAAVAGETVIDPCAGGAVELRVSNGSSIVDGYRIEALGAPPWLLLDSSPVEMMPGTDTVMRVAVGVRSGGPAVAQRLPLRLRVHSVADAAKATDVALTLVVPEIGDPPSIRTEPAAVRLRDATGGQFTVHLDNRGSNHPRRCVLSGVDDEGVVRFAFAPPVAELAPGGHATVAVRFTSPAPEPGTQANRRLTVRATQGEEQVEAAVGLAHLTSPPDPAVKLRLQPALLRTRDQWSVEVVVVVDNRAGERARRLALRGRDQEDRIRFQPRVTEVAVPPDAEVAVRLRLDARGPDPGTEVTRPFTVVAGDGEQESEVSGSWVQAASGAPITTAAVRLEPEHLRVRDQPTGRYSVVVDNARGSRPLRVRLTAGDPENAVAFTFRPPVLDVAPGTFARGMLTVSAPLPPHGQGAVRALRVWAADDNGRIETSGAFEQSTSPTPLSTARIALDPQQAVARDSRTGRLRVRLDNRAGTAPLQVRLAGVDPERIVRFRFEPPVLDVAPGQVGWSVVTVTAPRPGSGRELVRPLSVVADDGHTSIDAAGSFVQSTRPLRPILRVVLTVLGALLVAAGAFLPWLVGDSRVLLPTVPNVVRAVTTITSSPPPADPQEAGDVLRLAQPMERLATVAMAILMLFGLTGRSGRLTRLTALLVTLTMAAASVFYLVVQTGRLDVGSLLVLLGGVVGYAGGRAVTR